MPAEEVAPLSWSAGTCIRVDKAWPPCPGASSEYETTFMSTLDRDRTRNSAKRSGASAATCWFSSGSRSCRRAGLPIRAVVIVGLMTTVRRPTTFLRSHGTATQTGIGISAVATFRKFRTRTSSIAMSGLRSPRPRAPISSFWDRLSSATPSIGTRCVRHRCSIGSRSTTWHSSAFAAESSPAG